MIRRQKPIKRGFAAFRPPSAELMRGRRIGLLGGSFNPSHAAHRAISIIALRELKLDQVWWLISPQNPLKSKNDMAPYTRRVLFAKHQARHPRIVISEIEDYLGTQFTVDTVRTLREAFPSTHFVWLMGSDNLAQFHRWRDWSRIAKNLPIAIFARPSKPMRDLHSKAARALVANRLNLKQKRLLAVKRGNAWIYVPSKRYPLSATSIRATTSGDWWQ